MTFSTAAGSHPIPDLSEEGADRVRRQIADSPKSMERQGTHSITGRRYADDRAKALGEETKGYCDAAHPGGERDGKCVVSCPAGHRADCRCRQLGRG